MRHNKKLYGIHSYKFRKMIAQYSANQLAMFAMILIDTQIPTHVCIPFGLGDDICNLKYL